MRKASNLNANTIQFSFRLSEQDAENIELKRYYDLVLVSTILIRC